MDSNYLENFNNLYCFCTQGNEQNRKHAETYFINCIMKDPEFFKLLQNVYINSPSFSQKRFALILMAKILWMNPTAIINATYFKEFVNNIFMISKYTFDLVLTHPELNSMFPIIASMIIKISQKTGFKNRLIQIIITQYTKNQEFLPLSFEMLCYILSSSENDDERIKALMLPFVQLANIHFFNIINLCLAYPYTDLQFRAVSLFASTSEKITDSDKVGETCQILFSKAQILFQDINNINELLIQRFWSNITDLDHSLSEPFFVLANKVLESPELDSILDIETKYTMMCFILSKHRFIRQDMIQAIIERYFFYLNFIEPDPSIMLFNCIIQNFDGSYIIAKSIIDSYLKSGNHRRIFIGMFHLSEFVEAFSQIIVNDKEYIIQACKVFHNVSPELANCSVRVLSVFSNDLILNPEEMQEIANILKAVTEMTNDVLTKGYILKSFYNMGRYLYSSRLFDGLFEMNPYFINTNVAMYLSALNNLCHNEINLTNMKYDALFQFVVNCWQESFAELNRLQTNEEYANNNISNISTIKEILSNCAIFLINLYIRRPSTLVHLVAPAINVIICDMESNYQDEYDDDDVPEEIKTSPSTEFNRIIGFGKGVLVEHLRQFYPKIVELNDELKTQSIIMKIDYENCPFRDYFKESVRERFLNIDIVVVKNNFPSFIDYMIKINSISPGVFMIDDQDLLLQLIDKVNSFRQYLAFSPQLFSYATNFLNSFIKPSHIKKVQHREWYPNIIIKVGNIMTSWAEFFNNNTNLETFSCLALSMMSTLTLLKHPIYREFFEKIFYQKMYLPNPKLFALELIEILRIFVSYGDVDYHIIEEVISQFVSIDFKEPLIKYCFIDFLRKFIRKAPQKALVMREWIINEWQNLKPEETCYQAKVATILLAAFNIIPNEFGFVGQNIIAILSSFSLEPSKMFAKDILIFFEANKSNLSGDIVICLITQLVYYFGLQNFAHSIYRIPIDRNNQMLQTLKQLLTVCQTQVIDLVNEILKNQPSSIQYLLQILS